jgi:hypothetical protein
VDRQETYTNKSTQIEQLRQDLREAEDFIVKNNEEFVKELQVYYHLSQKYNEKIWRLES